ncbi:MFS transporter [Streptomyces violascens]|uniref:MFS transporter n=1 Tax=Streptomyces violascens TaxID=67381 RepID=UPI001999FB88|nr:MFS transporter [Streptomyces violascens]GGU37865.1 MFS transporter [Streptomyces violascens]
MSTTAAPVVRPDRAGTGATRRWPAAIWTLMVGTFLARGFGFTYPFLPYRLHDLHLSTGTVSAILAVFGAGWLAGSVLCGWLADRIGHRATLITAMLLAAAALPLLAQAHAVPALFAATFTAGIVYDASRPVFTAEIADTFPEDGVRASVNAWRHFAVNVGAAVAGTAGGMLAGPLGIQALIWINAGACTLFALLVWRFLPADPHPDPDAPRPANYRAALTDRGLWLLLLASLCALTCAASLFSSLPMLMAEDGLDAAAYGWTQTANAGAVLLVSPLLNRWLSRQADGPKPMTGLFAASSLALGASMGAAGFASTTLGYAATAALAVPGEIVVFVAASDLLNRLSPPTARGLYAGIWGTTLAGAVIIAPALAGWALTHGGGELAALTTITVGALGAALAWPLAALIHRAHPVPNHR